MHSNTPMKPSGLPDGAAWLRPHRDIFLAGLDRLGYAPGSLRIIACAIDHFCDQVGVRGACADDLGPSVLKDLMESVPMPRSTSARRQRRGYVARFVAHLAAVGAIDALPAIPAPPPDPARLLCEVYGGWLRRDRGLSPSTVSRRQTFLRTFLTFRFGSAPADWGAITPDDIQAFLDRPPMAPGRGPGLPDRATALRSLFRFLFATGRTRRDLTLGMPPVAARRARAIRRHLGAADVQRLVASVGDDDRTGRRDRAVLLLMSRLGLRAHEVIAIRLDDIDWPAGEIVVRGKRRFHDRMPVPVDVGEAMAAYVMHERPGTAARHLFVTPNAPHRPYASAQFIRSILGTAFARTGLAPPTGGVHTHVLRHSLAVTLLEGGDSLDRVGDVLRHRSPASTALYARHDIESLRPLARPWPMKGEAA